MIAKDFDSPSESVSDCSEEGQCESQDPEGLRSFFLLPLQCVLFMGIEWIFVISISSNTPVGTELVKEEQMAYWQYIGETRLHPEDQIPS